MNWRAIGIFGTVYAVLLFPLAMLLGRLLHRASLRTIPAAWLEPGQQPPCLRCGGQTEVRFQDDAIWLCCSSCGSNLPAEIYQLHLSD